MGLNDFTCLIDNKAFDNEKDLHNHLKKLKVKQSDYYLKYYNKKDLFTGEPIQFKNREQYFNADFTGRDTMKKWFVANPALAKEYSKGLLKKRKGS